MIMDSCVTSFFISCLGALTARDNLTKPKKTFSFMFAETVFGFKQLWRRNTGSEVRNKESHQRLLFRPV